MGSFKYSTAPHLQVQKEVTSGVTEQKSFASLMGKNIPVIM